MKIYKKGAEILTKVAEPIDLSKGVTTELIMLSAKMFNIMYEEHGVGLACPQVGRSIQMVVIDCSRDEITPLKGTLINPTITHREGTQMSLEGCLSVKNQWYKIERPGKITVEYINVLGDSIVKDLEGPTAAVVCHELDHLKGVLICDIGEEIDDPRRES